MAFKKIKTHVARALAVTIVAGTISVIPMNIEAKAAKDVLETSSMKITAKSEKGDHPVKYAMDGKKDTYWESSNHYRWVEIDLGGTYSLESLKIFNKIGGYYHYNIYASSDGENFIKVAAKENSNVATAEGDSYNLGNVNANKLRIDVTFSSENNDSNIAEIEINGNKVNNNVSTNKDISVEDFKDSKWENEYKKFETDTKYANAKTIAEMSAMVGRVIGNEYKDKFVFEVRKATTSGNDVFEVKDGADGKIVIRGNNGVSLASGFNYYLKNYANVMYNPIMGSNLNMPKTLPEVGKTIVKDTPYEERYSLNFCTYSYTMSFWDWDEYEAFLDWSAMNGYNLMLDIIGQEEVLRRTLNEFGYSDEEVKEFISGPAYFAWFYMQNMTSFGGPLPDNWFEDRVELGRKMHDRMQTYGIKPVLQGYSGMVPLDFQEKHKDAQILEQGEWCGFARPNMVKTFVNEGEKDYFAEIADVFYAKQKEVYGDVTDYYAVDPFHEGGNTGGIGDGKIYNTIQKKMIEHDEDAIWVIQHWQGNPSNDKVNGLYNKEQALILDLNSDLNPDYKRFDGLDVPWVWNMLHNFGGRMGLDGQVETIATQIPEALANTKHMKGVGITPEAINNSPIVYELLGDMIWSRDAVNYREWTQKYIERRYGKVNESASKAWDILLETAYKKSDYYYQGAAESVINARPAMSINSASTWGHSKIPYNKKELEKAMELFIECYDELKDSDAFVYDFLDVTKQVLANSAQEYHKEMVAAYNEKDSAKFDKISTHFLDLIRLQERVLSTSPEFLVGTWIEQSRTMLANADDWTKDLFEFNARALITTWGDYKNGGLKDYSNRQWAGLTGDLYLKRWEKWVDGLSNELKTGKKAPSINWYKMEYEWANTKTTANSKYTTEGSGENLAELAKVAMKDFSVTNMNEFLGGAASNTEKVNIALNKKVTSSVPTDEKYPTSNLTDGTNGTAWIAKDVTWPATLTLDLEEVKNIDGIQFALNQAAGGFPIKYTVEVLSGGKWIEVAKHDEGNITGTIAIDYKGTAEQVRLNLNSDSDTLKPELTEIMVFEGAGEKIKYDNVALGKPAKASVASQSPATNLTDGDSSTLWVANGEGIGSYVEVDLTKEEYVEKVQVEFEKAGLPFQFKVEVIESGDDKNPKVVLDMTKNQEALNKSYTVDVNKNIEKIIVTITGKNGQGQWPGAWAALAEIKALRQQKEEIPAVNIALDKEVEGSVAQSGRPLSNITDGDESTLWVANGGVMPSYAQVNLGREYFVEDLELVLEKSGLPFKFVVETIDNEGNITKVLDKENNDKVLEQSYTIKVNDTIKAARVRIVGKAPVGGAQGAWPAIAELKINSKPENVAAKGTITPNADGKMNNLIDGDEGTSVSLTNSDAKEYVVDFGKKSDIYGIEMSKSSNEALKYKVEYATEDGGWKVLFDKLANDKNKEVYLDILDSSVYTDKIRVTYGNENVVLNELKVYKADLSGELLNYISKVESIYKQAQVGDVTGTYTQAAKDELGKAIQDAKTAAANGLSSVEANNEVNKLKEALNKFYKSYIVIDRIELAALISEADAILDTVDNEKLEKLSEEERSLVEDVIKVLREERDKAVAVYETNKVNQEQINVASKELRTSINSYVEVATAEMKYDAVIAIAKELAKNAVAGQGNGQYSQEAIDELNEAINKAQADFESAQDATAMTNIANTLEEAVKKFENSVVVVDKSELGKAINLAKESLTNNEGLKYPAVVEEFEAAIGAAEAVLNNANVNQEEVNNAITALNDAKTKFEESTKADKSEIVVLVEYAKGVVNKLKEHGVTGGIVAKLEEAIKNSEAVINNDNATSEEVNNAKDLLNKAIEEGNAKISEIQASIVNKKKEELKSEIKKAEKLNKDKYTVESYATLERAIKEGNKLVENKNATKEEVEQAIKAIQTAVEGLVKDTTPKPPTNNGGNQGNGGTGNQGNGGTGNGGTQGNGETGNQGNGGTGNGGTQGNGGTGNQGNGGTGNHGTGNAGNNKPSSPKTGDASLGLAFTGLLAGVGVLFGRKKNK